MDKPDNIKFYQYPP